MLLGVTVTIAGESSDLDILAQSADRLCDVDIFHITFIFGVSLTSINITGRVEVLVRIDIVGRCIKQLA